MGPDGREEDPEVCKSLEDRNLISGRHFQQHLPLSLMQQILTFALFSVLHIIPYTASSQTDKVLTGLASWRTQRNQRRRHLKCERAKSLEVVNARKTRKPKDAMEAAGWGRGCCGSEKPSGWRWGWHFK